MAKYKYVYGLCDPRNPLQPIFYVGKGSGDRKVQHFRNIPKGMQGDKKSEKYKIIQSIKDAGLTPSVVILSHHETDDEAYKAEQEIIAKIGQANLTNKSKGGEGITTKGKPSTPVALTEKQEHFCQLMVASTAPSSDNYRIAYNAVKATKKSVNEMASELMRNPKVTSRIEELRAPVIKKLRYSYEGQLAKFDNAYNLAEETGNAGAMTGATDKQTKLLDLYPADKLKVDLDADALVVRIQQGRAKFDDL